MSKRKTVVTVTLVTAASALLGMGAGVAVAAGPTLLAPLGVRAEDGAQSEPMPEPTYSVNQDGLTFGSAMAANSPTNEPDLILVVATNGIEGYAKKVDLDAANGAAAATTFKTPADALAWQESEGRKDHVVPVYKSDGETVVGEFVVIGGDAQDALLKQH